jgi:hypothetical protein
MWYSGKDLTMFEGSDNMINSKVEMKAEFCRAPKAEMKAEFCRAPKAEMKAEFCRAPKAL